MLTETRRCKEKRRTINVPTTTDHSHTRNVYFFLPSVKKPRFLGSSRRPSDEAGIVCARDDAAAASTPAAALMLAIQLFISFYSVDTMSRQWLKVRIFLYHLLQGKKNSSGFQCKMASGSFAKLLATHCPTNGLWTRSLQLERPTYAPVSWSIPQRIEG